MHGKVVVATICGTAILAAGSVVIGQEITTSNHNDCARADVLKLFLTSDAQNKDSAAQRTLRAAELRRRLASQEHDSVQRIVLTKDAERFELSASESLRLATYWRVVLVHKLQSSTCK